jgi:hypothetical protein
MESKTNQDWFLSKHKDCSVFGPLRFGQVQRWPAAQFNELRREQAAANAP